MGLSCVLHCHMTRLHFIVTSSPAGLMSCCVTPSYLAITIHIQVQRNLYGIIKKVADESLYQFSLYSEPADLYELTVYSYYYL